MATTPNFSLRYPLSSDPVDVSNDLYKLATDSDTTLGTMLPKAGGTLTGNVTISKSSPILNLTAAAATHAILRLDSPAGYASDIALRSGTSNRWTFSKLNEAETGSDAGSNFVLYRYLDSGSYAEAIRITRATGLMTLTGDLTLNKNGGAFNLTAAAGSSLSLRMQTGGTNRWVLYKTSEAESGSDAGSNFQLYKYTDAGAGSVALEINRATGKTTLGSVGATAGLELGTSGPRMMSGTGSPESVVTAPVGSVWYQTDSTVGVTHWRKATGAGNTGWVVMSGDTGWRNVSASLDSTFKTANPNATMWVRRVNDTVEWRFNAGTSGTLTTNYSLIYSIPAGFRFDATSEVTMSLRLGSPSATTNCLYSYGNTEWRNGSGWTSGQVWFGNVTHSVASAWPTSLPGTP